MSDYLSSLAARSLRREPACEPRRAQMFEPRPETPGSAFAEEVHDEPAGAETVSKAPAVYEHDGGVLSEPRPDFHTTQSPLRTSAQPSRTSHTRTGEDVPASTEHTPHVAPSAEPAREATPTLAAPPPPTNDAALEAAGEPSSPNAPRDVKVIPQRSPAAPSPVHVSLTSDDAPSVEAVRESPSPKVLAPSPSTTNAATEATGESLSPNAPHEVKAITQTPPATPQPAHAGPTSSRRARTTEERALLAGAFDEEVREEAPAVERRVAGESKGSAGVLEVEVIPRTAKPPQSDSDSEPLSRGVLQPPKPAASAEARPFTEVRPATAQPSAPREERAQTQTPPTIEVTIGRIEVRAVTPPAPPPRQRREPPRMSLDDYLRARDGGRS